MSNTARLHICFWFVNASLLGSLVVRNEDRVAMINIKQSTNERSANQTIDGVEAGPSYVDDKELVAVDACQNLKEPYGNEAAPL